MINVNESEKNLNSGHRKRMRESFLKRDLDTFAEHEILEILLFYAYSRRDTNKIAHRLINRFGTLQGVFSAPYEELVKVEDVGENAASLIILFSRLAEKYNRDIYNKREVISDTRIIQMLSERFKNEKDEVVAAMFFDDKDRYLTTSEITRGKPMESMFKTRDIVDLIIRYDADKVLIAHNHPRGFCVPSAADAKATRDIKRVLDAMGVVLVDHMIFSDNDYFSFKTSGKYEDIFMF